MLGARGASLRMGGINLNDLSNLHSSNAAAAKAKRALIQQRRLGGVGGGVVGAAASVVGDGGRCSPKKMDSPMEIGGDTEMIKNLPHSVSAGGLMEPTLPIAEPLPKKKTRIVVVKKSLDRSTFWSVCRAVIFGTLLIALGVAMCTIGFYKSYFATEIVTVGNDTVTFLNPSTKVHFESLSYIGPCVMGVGMFILMMACVMTLEGRDMNTQIYSRRLSRKNSERRSVRSALVTVDHDKLKEQKSDHSKTFDKSQTDDKNNLNKNDSDNNSNKNNNGAKKDNIISNNNNHGESQFSETNNVGQVNQCFSKDDSRQTNSVAATTELTWSIGQGPRCEPLPKAPVHVVYAMPSIDVVSKNSEARVLLQRFLEDQSRLVDARMERMRLKNSETVEQPKSYNASTDIPTAGTSCIPADEYSWQYQQLQQQRRHHSVVAEVHHSVDAESPLTNLASTSQSTAAVAQQVQQRRHPLVAPMASGELSENYYSPMMTLSSTTPNGYLSALGGASSGGYYSTSPSLRRQKLLSISDQGSQHSVNSYTTVKSHASDISNGYAGLDNATTATPSDLHYSTALTLSDPAVNNNGDYVNANDFPLDNRREPKNLHHTHYDERSTRPPYPYSTPMRTPLYVMHNAYNPPPPPPYQNRTKTADENSSSLSCELPPSASVAEKRNNSRRSNRQASAIRRNSVDKRHDSQAFSNV